MHRQDQAIQTVGGSAIGHECGQCVIKQCGCRLVGHDRKGVLVWLQLHLQAKQAEKIQE